MKWYDYAPNIAMIVQQVMKEMNPDLELTYFHIKRQDWDDFALFHYDYELLIGPDSYEEYFCKNIHDILDDLLNHYRFSSPMEKEYYNFNVAQKEKCINYILNTLLYYDESPYEGINRSMLSVFVNVFNILKNNEVYNIPFTIKANMRGIDICDEVEIITSALVLMDFLLNDTHCSEEDTGLIKSKYDDLEKYIAKLTLLGNEVVLEDESINMYFCFYLYYVEEYARLLNEIRLIII